MFSKIFTEIRNNKILILSMIVAFGICIGGYFLYTIGICVYFLLFLTPLFFLNNIKHKKNKILFIFILILMIIALNAAIDIVHENYFNNLHLKSRYIKDFLIAINRIFFSLCNITLIACIFYVLSFKLASNNFWLNKKFIIIFSVITIITSLCINIIPPFYWWVSFINALIIFVTLRKILSQKLCLYLFNLVHLVNILSVIIIFTLLPYGITTYSTGSGYILTGNIFLLSCSFTLGLLILFTLLTPTKYFNNSLLTIDHPLKLIPYFLLFLEFCSIVVLNNIIITQTLLRHTI